MVIPSPQIAGSGVNYTAVLPGHHNEDQFNTNFDRSLGTSDQLSAKFFFSSSDQNVPFSAASVPGFPADRNFDKRQSPESPESIAGTLSNMAPEQNGSMNRSIDSRSDLYSLGVTLYQTLTGSLPLTASDPMEWVHCHLARKPIPIEARFAEVPSQVSAIVMRLLAKAPEERYQTAARVERDLRRCLGEWESRGVIEEFPLGEQDRPHRLMIPERLYGREHEINALVAAFEHVVASGTPSLVLVSGHPGIGKSAVVNELHRVLVPPPRPVRIRQVRSAEARHSLRHPGTGVLSKPEAELSTLQDNLRQAGAPNGALAGRVRTPATPRAFRGCAAARGFPF